MGTIAPMPDAPDVFQPPRDYADLIAAGFETIDRELGYLVDCFREVLVGLGEDDLAAHLADVNHLPDGPPPERVAQVDSVWFQLLNMVEESAAAQVRRLREGDLGPAAEPGLWGETLRNLRQGGLDDAQVADALPHVRVEPVLTAHPTEAKPSTVIEQHRAVFRLLESLDGRLRTEAERDEHRAATCAALERLWRAGEILQQKPDVTAERANLLFYLREVFPEAIDGLDGRLRRAWQAAGHDPARLADAADYPTVTFGFWAGGDRDGHPMVTHRTTADTLSELRRGALASHAKALGRLADRMGLSSQVQTPPAELTDRIAALARSHPRTAQQAAVRHPNEPWRHLAILLRAHLPAAESRRPASEPSAVPPDDAAMPAAAGGYGGPGELLDDLRLLRRALGAVGAGRLAREDVDPVIRRVSALGFHLAKLDVRQNSGVHDRAMSQLLSAAGFGGAATWADWPERERLDLLNRELGGPRPFARFGRKIGPECDEVLATYRVLARHGEERGFEALGPLIVSMTHRLSDLLCVYVFAREAGLARFEVDGEKGGGRLVCPLPVVPLFETFEDLEKAPDLMADFLDHPTTRASMNARPGRPPSLLTARGATLPVQQVMLGYSDSNKASGILAAQHALHQCQERLTAVADDKGVRLRFFHGRGGTISRGAGPTHRFLQSLPQRSLGGDVRLTEQGETVAQKFANPATATYNLELLVAGVTGVTLRNRSRHGADRPRPHPLHPAAEALAAFSREAYDALVAADGFIDFFRQATPIDALEQANIGSRPSRRTGQRTLDDLRAIPWVFSWNQARFYLPGWYGVGTALERLAAERPDLWAQLADPETGVGTFAFLKYVLTNVETNLASADRDLMGRYAALVEDGGLRDRMLGRIAGEFERSERMLNDLFGGDPLPRRRPRMVKTLVLRDDRLRVLHLRQIDLLRRWRPECDPDDPRLPELLLNVNAIASGLRTTG